MGVVCRATQPALERLVALKLITPALAEDPDFRQRFVTARIRRSLSPA